LFLEQFSTFRIIAAAITLCFRVIAGLGGLGGGDGGAGELLLIRIDIPGRLETSLSDARLFITNNTCLFVFYNKKSNGTRKLTKITEKFIYIQHLPFRLSNT
jgi:hypothetical protein